jgi:hypothetical protein
VPITHQYFGRAARPYFSGWLSIEFGYIDGNAEKQAADGVEKHPARLPHLESLARRRDGYRRGIAVRPNRKFPKRIDT